MAKKIFLFCLSIFAMINSAEAVTLNQQMDVNIGVFDAAKIELNYKANQDNFLINAIVNTANLFNTLYPFKGKYQSKGDIVNDKMKPEIYETETQTRNHVRTKKIFYDDKGIAYKRLSTKDKKVSEKPIINVPPSVNAADLQSVFADLLNQFLKTQSCNMTREVYDGKKHYKVIAKDNGMDKRYFTWYQKEEQAYRCSIYIENLKDNNDNILWEVTAEKPIKLWIGQDKKTKMPFVLQIVIDSTPLGMLEVTPSKVEIN
jgi:hypothetical protein